MLHSVAINELGRRIGDSHHMAKLSNGEVELIRQLHEEGFGYRRLAAKFEISKRHVRDIIHGRKRCQSVAGHRMVRLKVHEAGKVNP